MIRRLILFIAVFLAVANVTVAKAQTVPRNTLNDTIGSLSVTIRGQYTDCTGQTPLPMNGAYIDTCITNVTGIQYFVGHDVSWIFHNLHQLRVGEAIYDNGADGRTYLLLVVGVRDNIPLSALPLPPVMPGVVAQFQTCDDYSPNYDLLIDTVLLGSWPTN